MDEKLAAVITQEQVQSVLAPIASALSLPAGAYASSEWFALERDRLFSRRWCGVLFDAMLPNTGDAIPFEFLAMPLVAVRGRDSRVRVFHNICPYDGCLVVRHPQQGVSELVVLYHGWRYDLEGKLLAAPYWNGEPQCARHDLHGYEVDLVEVRSAVRLGVVLINLSGQAQSVDAWLAPWRQVVGQDYALDELRPAVDENAKALVEERTVEANWKTYQENASINILHEAFTHALYQKSPEVPRVDAEKNRRYTTYIDQCLVAFAHSRQDSGQTYDHYALPFAGHDPNTQPDNGYFTTLFPNLNVPALDVMLKVNLAIPLSAGKTKLLHLRFYRPEALRSANFLAEERAVQKLFDEVHYEDQLAIEAVQAGRLSPMYTQHYYAPFWDALHHRFNQLVMEDLLIA